MGFIDDSREGEGGGTLASNSEGAKKKISKVPPLVRADALRCPAVRAPRIEDQTAHQNDRVLVIKFRVSGL